MDSDKLNAIFQALSDPTRRAILTRLAKGPASVTDLAKPFDISQPAVSRHLKVLEQAGLLARKPVAQWRTCVLVPGPLKEAADWLRTVRRR
jgi:DNA-binding transcriptional ArsR family regulator